MKAVVGPARLVVQVSELPSRAGVPANDNNSPDPPPVASLRIPEVGSLITLSAIANSRNYEFAFAAKPQATVRHRSIALPAAMWNFRRSRI